MHSTSSCISVNQGLHLSVRSVFCILIEFYCLFRPTGNLIATSRIRDTTRDIIFYERNGQRRSDFELGPHEGTVINWMAWSIDGSILCVRLGNREGLAEEGINCLENILFDVKIYLPWFIVAPF